MYVLHTEAITMVQTTDLYRVEEGKRVKKSAMSSQDDKTSTACVDCQAFPESELMKHGACQAQYDNMNQCMKLHRGVIGECVPEWGAFRLCHEDSKSKQRATKIQNPKSVDPNSNDHLKSIIQNDKSSSQPGIRIAGLREVRDDAPAGWLAGWLRWR